MTLAAGSLLGPYEVIEPLGAGGMGLWREIVPGDRSGFAGIASVQLSASGRFRAFSSLR